MFRLQQEQSLSTPLAMVIEPVEARGAGKCASAACLPALSISYAAQTSSGGRSIAVPIVGRLPD